MIGLFAALAIIAGAFLAQYLYLKPRFDRLSEAIRQQTESREHMRGLEEPRDRDPGA